MLSLMVRLVCREPRLFLYVHVVGAWWATIEAVTVGRTPELGVEIGNKMAAPGSAALARPGVVPSPSFSTL